nr:caspase family protein [uncultured Desulfobacter sp.]
MISFNIKKRMIPAWALILIISAGGFGCVPANQLSLESLKKFHENFSKKNRETDSSTDRTITIAPANKGASEDQSRIALVVGNSNYKYAPRLANPRNDARDMCQALTRMGFQVAYLAEAPDDKTMARAVRKFGERLSRQKNTVGLFFYAGHAVQVDGANYLIPVNAKIQGELDMEYDTFNVANLMDTLNKADNDFNMVILDACRDNPFKGFTRSTSRGLAKMDSPQGTLIAFSTAPGEKAEDGRGRNGTYTKHLLKHIEEPGIDIEEMFKRVGRGVKTETHGRQIPFRNSSFYGDFCFGGCSDPLEEVRLEKERLEEQQRELELLKEELKQQRTTGGPSPATAADVTRKRAELKELNRKLEQQRQRLLQEEQPPKNRPAVKETSMPPIAF